MSYLDEMEGQQSKWQSCLIMDLSPCLVNSCFSNDLDLPLVELKTANPAVFALLHLCIHTFVSFAAV